MVREQAKRAGLDPLEHQALVQVFGASVREGALRQSPRRAARRRPRTRLPGPEAKNLVARGQSDEDKRVTRVIATDSGVASHG
jgi:hypothetical protein